MKTEQRLKELGIELVKATGPMANYVNAVRAGNLLFLAGKGPGLPGQPLPSGKVGRDFTIEQGYAYARETGLNLIAVMKAELGDLDKVKRIVAELTQFGKVRPAWVGLDVEPLSLELSRRLGWERTYGALISNVEEGSPAQAAGIQRGDIVTQVGTTQVENADDLNSRLHGVTAKAPVHIGLFRAGQELQVELTPHEFPHKLVDSTVWERLGLRLKAIAGGMQVTSVRPNSNSASVGLAPGDIVLRINQQPVTNAETYREAVIQARGKRSVLLLVKRGSRGYYLTMPF